MYDINGMVFGLEAEEERRRRRRRREEGNFEDGVMMWVPEWRGENAIQRPYHSSINSLGFRVFTLFLVIFVSFPFLSKNSEASVEPGSLRPHPLHNLNSFRNQIIKREKYI